MSLRKGLASTVLKPARAAGALGWTVSMLAAVSVNEALVAPARRERVFESYMRPWARALVALMGARVELAPGLPSPSQGARLVVSNHRSAVDIGILLTYFGGSLVSRADLEHWPIVGACAKKAQTIFVDRDSRHSGLLAIKAIREQLQRRRTVCVFPEGTTFAGDQVRPFARGLFAAARGLEVEIVPVGLAYPAGCEYTQDSFAAHLADTAARPRTRVAMEIGSSIALASGDSITAESMREEVQRLVDRARGRLDGR